MYQEQNNQTAPVYFQDESQQLVSSYLAKVMGWMCIGLAVTTVIAISCFLFRNISFLIFSSPYTFFAVFGVQIAIVLGLSFGLKHMSASVATVLYLIYSAVTGITVFTITAMFDRAGVLSAFISTVFLFVLMAVYGNTTKKDLTKLGTLALFGLVGVIMATIVNLFFRLPMIDTVISAIAVVVFLALIAYDTQKIKAIYLSAVQMGHEHQGEVTGKLAIMGAFTLYLDFINLFLRLVRLMARRRR